MKTTFALMLFALLTVSSMWVGADTVTDPPEGKVYVYKETNGVPLEMEIYFPPNWDPTGRKSPGLILFHGGGWGGGSLSAFRYQCHYFASRGLVAATVNYTLAKKQKDQPPGESRKRICIVDAKSAIRWMKKHAEELGIDPRRIITGGGSAGGHISMLATHNPGLNDPNDPPEIDTSVAAYVLFNPAFADGDKEDSEVDILQHLRVDMPAAVVFFGTEDTWKPGWDAAQRKLELLGNRNIELQMAPGQAHAFFNKQPWKDLTVIAADRFLTNLGFLKGQPTLLLPKTGERLIRSE
jgi:acetyl esterase